MKITKFFLYLLILLMSCKTQPNHIRIIKNIYVNQFLTDGKQKNIPNVNYSLLFIEKPIFKHPKTNICPRTSDKKYFFWLVCSNDNKTKAINLKEIIILNLFDQNQRRLACASFDTNLIQNFSKIKALWNNYQIYQLLYTKDLNYCLYFKHSENGVMALERIIGDSTTKSNRWIGNNILFNNETWKYHRWENLKHYTIIKDQNEKIIYYEKHYKLFKSKKDIIEYDKQRQR